MLTIIKGYLEIRHDVGVMYFHSEQERPILELKGLPIPVPEFLKCRVCDTPATQISITDSLYCEDCKEGHEIECPVKPYKIEVLRFSV